MKSKAEEKKRFTRRTLVSIGCFLYVTGTTVLVRAQFLPSGAWKEFTVVRSESTKSFLNGGGLATVRFEAQRGDGSFATGPTAKTGRYGGTRSIILRPQGLRVFVDDLMKMKSTYSLKGPSGAPLPDPTCGFARISPTANPVNKGEEEILGFKTVIVQTKVDNYLTTDWKAPELDCADLKMTEDRMDETGHVTDHFELAATQVTLGPPATSLFDIPADYKEVPPSTIQVARRQAFNLPDPPAKVLDSLNQSDSEYQNQKSH